LWQSGCDASLLLKTRDGKATINLQLGLGQAPPTPFFEPPPRHVPGPSRQRRTKRRALIREQAEQAQAKNDVEEVAENANEEVDKNESETAEIATEVVETDGTSADKAAEVSEEARKDFPCLICDFVSSWETALQIQMTEKHSTVEQVDGNATLTDEDLVEDDKYSDTCHY
jgi:cell division protein FtsN